MYTKPEIFSNSKKLEKPKQTKKTTEKKKTSRFVEDDTESQDEPGWKRPLRLSSSTYDLAPPSQPDHGTEHHIQYFFKHLQGR